MPNNERVDQPRIPDDPIVSACVQIGEAVGRTAAWRGDPPHRVAFNLARRLRGLSELKVNDARLQYAILACFDALVAAGEEYVHADSIELNTLAVEMLECWPKIRRPGDALSIAVRCARVAPVQALKPLVPFPDMPSSLTAVMSVAFHLQRVQGDQPIILPRRQLGEALGYDRTSIGNAVGRACSYGVLTIVSNSFSSRAGIAKKYRFDFDTPHVELPSAAQLAECEAVSEEWLGDRPGHAAPGQEEPSA